ncbi:DUF4422 domain-containing protein [Leuconostoc sp. C2]|uniref:DUF4422 domain-containing protein n=1 Tax=Leuconostoc sp. (strain C2) TaxID=979982 RepID=UPI00021756B9|nr:DUF4422 domain-containing protein [Leuconostoc sp. C2]AEJ30696.1 glycosyltransferase [Leuconostoc sp. C2]
MVEKIQILVAAHKQVPMPTQSIYVPTQVGAALSAEHFDGFVQDNTGRNISSKNPYFNELTALYWARYNSDAEVIGLVHYRRFFSFSRQKNSAKILDESTIRALLSQKSVIVPKKRRYWIESSESHYRHAHHGVALDVLREVIATKQPDYLTAYDYNMAQTWAHMFNMFIMPRAEYNDYIDWLFDILFAVEQKMQSDVVDWDAYEKRVYGFLSERLLDVWLEKNHISYIEVPVVFMEKQNWLLKGGKFLARKIGFGRV